jgi:F420H(2)-dependent quinone reductase
VREEAPSTKPINRPGAGSRVMFRVVGAVHRTLYRFGLGRKMGQLQQVMLTTTGRKSGRQHTTVLGAVPEGDGWVVIASYGGADVHPNWWLNLVANPQATLTVGDQTMRVRMQEVTEPAERGRIWDRVVSVSPGYRNYEKKTSRVIPLGWLRPVS